MTSARPRSARIVKQALYALLTVAVLFFVGRALLHAAARVALGDIRPEWTFVALAFLALLFRKLVGGCLSYVLVLAFGSDIGWTVPAALSWVAMMGRYVPGKFASVAISTVVLVRYGVRPAAAMAVTLLPSCLGILIGTLMSAPLLFSSSARELIPGSALWAGLILVVILVSLYPRVFMALVGLVLTRLHREPLAERPQDAKLVAAVVLAALRTAFYGLAAWCLARAVSPVGVSDLPFVVSVSACSAVVGFLAFFAPAGIGVREGLFYVLLSPLVGQGTAALAAVLIRVAEVAMDLLLGLVGLLLLRLAPAPEPGAQPAP
jgi:hypothetical protein